MLNESPKLANASPWKSAWHSEKRLAILLGLSALFAAMRAVGLLGPSSLRALLPLSFCLMMATPWIFLTAQGRRDIGLQRALSWRYLVPACAIGVLAALICFWAGVLLFGHSQDNWFISIANNYRNTLDTSYLTMLQLHLFFTIPALLFSPLGEEIYFRGVLQSALEERCSVRHASVIEASIFGLIHLCHHGLLPVATGIFLLPLSGALWVVLMFAVALLFAFLRKRSASLYPAVAAHGFFNLSMNTAIFAWLW